MREATAAIFALTFGAFCFAEPFPCAAQPRFGAPMPINSTSDGDTRRETPHEQPVVRDGDGLRSTGTEQSATRIGEPRDDAAATTPEPRYRFDFEANRFVPVSQARRPPAVAAPRRTWPRRDSSQGTARRDGRTAPAKAEPATPPPPLVFASPPELVALPGSWIYAVADHEGEIFFVEGIWWRRHEGRWLRSHFHDHDWREFEGTPYFAREIPDNWKTLVLAGRWTNREWHFQRISHLEVQRHWLAWKTERHWDWNPEVRSAGEELAQRRIAMSQVPLFDGSAEAVGGPRR